MGDSLDMDALRRIEKSIDVDTIKSQRELQQSLKHFPKSLQPELNRKIAPKIIVKENRYEIEKRSKKGLNETDRIQKTIKRNKTAYVIRRRNGQMKEIVYTDEKPDYKYEIKIIEREIKFKQEEMKRLEKRQKELEEGWYERKSKRKNRKENT